MNVRIFYLKKHKKNLHDNNKSESIHSYREQIVLTGSHIQLMRTKVAKNDIHRHGNKYGNLHDVGTRRSNEKKNILT